MSFSLIKYFVSPLTGIPALKKNLSHFKILSLEIQYLSTRNIFSKKRLELKLCLDEFVVGHKWLYGVFCWQIQELNIYRTWGLRNCKF